VKSEKTLRFHYLKKRTPIITSHPTATVKPTNKNNQTIFDKVRLEYVATIKVHISFYVE